jgi:hypothetical protein
MENTIPTELIPTITSNIMFLSENGFSETDLVTLGTDIIQVSNLIKGMNMTDDEIEVLKNGFVNSRPTDAEYLEANSYFLTYEEAGMPDPILSSTELSLTATPNSPEGKTISLFTDPSLNKFYEETGYVSMGNVYAASGNAGYTRPYVMFGAHGTTGGVDAGLVWYQEHNKWYLFMSAPNNGGWKNGQSYYDNNNNFDSSAGISNGGQAYLQLTCSGGQAHITLRNPSLSWAIIDEQTIAMGSGFNTTSSIELVRENTIARGYSGSYLNNVTWSQHYLYSTTKTAQAQQSFFKSSRSGYSPWATGSRYLTKGTGNGTASSMNYSGETSSLSIS